MNRWIQRAILALILLSAAALRLVGIDWDEYGHHHPDERYITWVATTIEWPDEWPEGLNPTTSTFNPYYWPPEANSKGIEVVQDEQRKFAYGHLPLYLGVAVTRIVEKVRPALVLKLPDEWLLTRDILNGAEMIEYRHLTAVTRALTAFIDLGTVGLLFLLARRLYGPEVGLLAAAFLAVNVMHIQLSHFFAFDPYVTFFAVAALYFIVMSAGERPPESEDESGPAGKAFAKGKWQGPTNRYLLLAAVSAGLAVGSKFAAILLFFPLLLSVYLVKTRKREWTMFALVTIAFLVFALTNPFALLDMSCELITPSVTIGPLHVPALDWRSCFLDNISTQGAMVRGEIDFPFTRQYSGTIPYLYHLESQLRWGMGPSLGIFAFSGFAWAVWQSLRRLEIKDWRLGVRQVTRQMRPEAAILLAWVLPFFLTTGAFYVKFMRYLQPVTPFLMLYAAALIYQGRRRIWRWGMALVVLLPTAVYALSFVRIYQQPHPWTAASQWIYANVEPQSLILSEQWDDALPISMVIDGKQKRRTQYQTMDLTWPTRPDERDDLVKLEDNLGRLAEAEYLALASNRGYGVIPRLPDRYPVSGQYYQLLFDGSLGYKIVAVYGRFPNLAGYYLKPDTFGWPGLRPPQAVAEYLAGLPGIDGGRADESFTVYDQPLTIIFENVSGKSAEEMERLFDLK
jgi:4-amino-4-deoxy-L-arabinose transferase-like glycosyltransferase